LANRKKDIVLYKKQKGIIDLIQEKDGPNKSKKEDKKRVYIHDEKNCVNVGIFSIHNINSLYISEQNGMPTLN